MDQLAIKLKNINKSFTIPHERMSTLKEHIMHLFRPATYETLQAVNNFSLDVSLGEFLGIIGENGSGKSTLLKIMAGILIPNSGEKVIQGRISPFIELGVGFQPELSGRENVFLYGSLLGLSREQIKKKYQDIVAFAELERFMDQKIKNYSSGMQVRLAFAIITQADADIYLIDEVLAVGDIKFQKKCFDFFRKLKRQKKTIIFVSHDLEAIKVFCDRVVLMKDGKSVASGETREVVDLYKALYLKNTLNQTPPQGSKGRIEIDRVELLDTSGDLKFRFKRGEGMLARVLFHAYEDMTDPVFQMQIFTEEGLLCHGDNTSRHDLNFDSIRGNNTISFFYKKLDLLQGDYLLQVKIWPAGFDGGWYTELAEPVRFFMESEDIEGRGVVFLETTWKTE